MKFLLLLSTVMLLFGQIHTPVFANTGIVSTKHNLSVSGPGPIKALTENRVCIFCHTPHNATPSTPLWNREIKPLNYNTYQSSTLVASIPQPTGPTRLCLTCHDGTIAIGNILGSEKIRTSQELTSGRASFLGTDISNDHPVSFPYHTSLPNSELSPALPPDLLTYEGGMIHCSTCHDPHDDTFGMFLAVDNFYSGLCIKCHLVNDWSSSSHASSANTWNLGLPNPWPINDRLDPPRQRHTVAENGCQNCHSPHNAEGEFRLMNYQREEENCYACHNGNVATKNIQALFSNFSTHPVSATTIGLTGNAHDTLENPTLLDNHVECLDCHNPHTANDISPAQAPRVSGKIDNVSGVNRFGSATYSASYEYEICFKCHGNTGTAISTIPRYVDETNTRLEFDSINPSYHPVVEIGNNQSDVPSLPSSYNPDMTAASMIYCTDCHDSDNSPAVGGTGPKGPHGSRYAPILRERYEIVTGLAESYSAYALCYRCHERLSILNDESFQRQTLTGGGGHNAHLNGHTAGLTQAASCATCHDPHGINDDGGSGDHTHLINFDRSNVFPAGANPTPLFIDQGSRSGSCILVCHGVTHDATNHSYP